VSVSQRVPTDPFSGLRRRLLGGKVFSAVRGWARDRLRVLLTWAEIAGSIEVRVGQGYR